MSLFIQIVILLVVLACMVLLLLAIRQLTNFQGFDDTKETLDLKQEVDQDGHILSDNNIFSTLVESKPEEKIKKDHRTTSK